MYFDLLANFLNLSVRNYELVKLRVEENNDVLIYFFFLIFDLSIKVIGSTESNVGSRTKPGPSRFVQRFGRA